MYPARSAANLNPTPIAPVIDRSRPAQETQNGFITEIGPLGKSANMEKELVQDVEIYEGTGTFIDTSAAYGRSYTRTGAGEFTLNFEATDLQEVVKVVLADILKQNYLIDPKVTGLVTLQTSRPLNKAELLPTLENLLRLNGAVMIRSGGVYKILPQAQAMAGQLSTTVGKIPSARGYAIRVVPLRHIAVLEMQKILEPFLPPDAPPVVDQQRNLMVLTGTREELDSLVEMVNTFDVDWLRGMSVGLFRLKNAEAKTMVTELEGIFGGKEGPMAGLVRFVPIERMNAMLVISNRPEHMRQANNWIVKLDKTADTITPRLYVYRVQNGKAKNLATVLAGIFGAESRTEETGAPAPELAPGETATNIGGGDSGGFSDSGEGIDSSTSGTGLGGGGGLGSGGGLHGEFGGQGTGDQLTVVSNKQLRIIADESNNSLVILARPQDYEMIEGALRNLDVVPLQVLIEASVVEVTLTDNLEYGIEWFFRNSVGGDFRGEGLLDLDPASTTSPRTTTTSIDSKGNPVTTVTEGLLSPLAALAAPNFSYAILSGGQIRAVLNALAEDRKVNVLSSPSLMVLDNQTAAIKVVNEIPVNTRQSQSVDNPNAPIVNNVEFKEAGVILEVLPRVNLGGRITLELQQDVTDVGEVELSTNTRSFSNATSRALSLYRVEKRLYWVV
jgi:general secretion pathway protein D